MTELRRRGINRDGYHLMIGSNLAIPQVARDTPRRTPLNGNRPDLSLDEGLGRLRGLTLRIAAAQENKHVHFSLRVDRQYPVDSSQSPGPK